MIDDWFIVFFLIKCLMVVIMVVLGHHPTITIRFLMDRQRRSAMWVVHSSRSPSGDIRVKRLLVDLMSVDKSAPPICTWHQLYLGPGCRVSWWLFLWSTPKPKLSHPTALASWNGGCNRLEMINGTQPWKITSAAMGPWWRAAGRLMRET